MLISKSIFSERAIGESIFDLLHDISKSPDAMSLTSLFSIANCSDFVSRIDAGIANKLVLTYVNLYLKVIECGKDPYAKIDLGLLRRLLGTDLIDEPTRESATHIFNASVKARLNIYGIDESNHESVSISYGNNRDASFSFYSILTDPDLLIPLLKQNDYLMFDSVVMQSSLSVLESDINALSDFLAKKPCSKRIEFFDDYMVNFLPSAAKHYGRHQLKHEFDKLMSAVRALECRYGPRAPQIKQCLSSCLESISIGYSTARNDVKLASDSSMPVDHGVTVVDMQKHFLTSREHIIDFICDTPGGPEKIDYISFNKLTKEDFLHFIKFIGETGGEPYSISRCIKSTINNFFQDNKLDKSYVDGVIDWAELVSSSAVTRQSVITALAISGKYNSEHIIRCIRSPRLVEFSSLLICSSNELKLTELQEIISVAKKSAKKYKDVHYKHEWSASMAEIAAHERIASCHIYPDIKLASGKVSKPIVIKLFDWAINNNRATRDELSLLAKYMCGNYHIDEFQDLLEKIKNKSTDLHEHFVGCMLREKSNSLQTPLDAPKKKSGRFAL